MTRRERGRRRIARARARRASALAITIALVLGLTVSAYAADWTNSRGDAGNTGSSSESLALPLTERWHSSAPAVEENGAVVANGIAYMSSNDGQLYAFDRTGAPVAGFPVATASSYGTPAVDATNGKVYVLASAVLYAFNLNGTSAWTKSVGATGNNYNVGPIVDGGFVYLKAGGTLKKYNAAGVSQWSVPSAGDNTQPAIMGNNVYVNTNAGQIRKYDKTTGAEVTTGGFPISTAASQAGLGVAGGKIFHKADQLYAYDAATGALLWSQADGGDSTYSDSPAVANGVVYTYGADSKAYAFDVATGAAKAGFPSVALGTSGGNYSSPAVAGGLVFIGAGQSQKLKVLGAAGTANAGVVLEEHLTFSDDPQGFDLISPVVSDGVVYAMLDGGGLYAFFAADSPWTGGGVTINSGAACTTSQGVTLTIDAGSNPNVTQMKISEDPLFTGASFEPFATSKAFTLSTGFGTKTVYVQFSDSSAQLSNVFNDSIEYAASCSRTLTVSRSGTGTGTVTSTPSGINCGATCSNSFANGAMVTLTATPTGGSTFTGWSGDCTGTGGCVVTMDANKAVTATFGSTGNPTLTVSKAGTGTGTVSSSPAGINCGTTCSAPFTSGTLVTLTATPTGGSTFSGWSGACSGTGSCAVTMNADKAVTATFAGGGGGLQITSTTAPTTITAGSIGRTHFTIRNTGANAIGTVVATVTVPAGSTPISATPSAGVCSAFSGGQATCMFGNIAPGGTRGIDVLFRTPAGATGPFLATIAATSSGGGSASAVGGPTVVASRPGYARGFVPPGGSISLGNDPTAANPLVATFELPKTGSGAPITLRVESAGAGTFCGGQPCAGRKILFLSPFTGYDDPNRPPELKLVWDTSIVGTSTSFAIYVQKRDNGPITTIPNCRNYGDEDHPDIADPHPCVEVRKRRSNGDIEAHILLLSGDPRFARR